MQTKDFKGQDLRGKSFKNQDLTGADFSDCDLRGVDFSFANLTDAKFCNARMGRRKRASFFSLFAQTIFGVISYFLLSIAIVISAILSFNDIKHIDINNFSPNFECSKLFAILWCIVFLLACIKNNWSYITLLMFITVPLFFKVVRYGSGFLALTVGLGASASVVISLSVILVGAISLIRILTGGGVFIFIFIFLLSSFMTDWSDNNSYPISLSLFLYSATGLYLGYRGVCKGEPQFVLWRNIVLNMACWHGTKFTYAILANSNFSNTDLKYVNFVNAKINNCNFKDVTNHYLALTDGTPLNLRKVRDLVIDGIITDKNFATLDLRGLDFSHLNLQDFDFSHANLSGANLSHTQLTGATLEGWNIDTETCLDDIDCRYYYYLENGAKKRIPPEGEEYGAGEFTRIFQKIANTIDFIAHNEMELAAIKLSVEQVRVESGNADIRVQAIEEKDGFIVVKVTVPKTEDRGVLYHEVNVLKQEYEAKIQGLMDEKHIQIGKIEALKEQLKEQRDDLLAAIKPSIQIDTQIIHGGNQQFADEIRNKND